MLVYIVFLMNRRLDMDEIREKLVGKAIFASCGCGKMGRLDRGL